MEYHQLYQGGGIILLGRLRGGGITKIIVSWFPSQNGTLTLIELFSPFVRRTSRAHLYIASAFVRRERIRTSRASASTSVLHPRHAYIASVREHINFLRPRAHKYNTSRVRELDPGCNPIHFQPPSPSTPPYHPTYSHHVEAAGDQQILHPSRAPSCNYRAHAHGRKSGVPVLLQLDLSSRLAEPHQEAPQEP